MSTNPAHKAFIHGTGMCRFRPEEGKLARGFLLAGFMWRRPAVCWTKPALMPVLRAEKGNPVRIKSSGRVSPNQTFTGGAIQMGTRSGVAAPIAHAHGFHCNAGADGLHVSLAHHRAG